MVGHEKLVGKRGNCLFYLFIHEVLVELVEFLLSVPSTFYSEGLNSIEVVNVDARASGRLNQEK